MADNKQMILELVHSSEDHPTADDIFHALREEGQHISLATVYNNLNSLCEEGKIRRITFGGKTVHYDKPVSHAHLVCSRCGKVTDLPVMNLLEKLEADCGVTADDYELKLIYLCPDCRAGSGDSAQAGTLK